MSHKIIIEYVDNPKKPGKLTLIDENGKRLLNKVLITVPQKVPEINDTHMDLNFSEVLITEELKKASLDSQFGYLLSQQPGRISSKVYSLFCAQVPNENKGLNGDKDYFALKKADFAILAEAIKKDPSVDIMLNKSAFMLDITKVNPYEHDLNAMIRDVVINHLPMNTDLFKSKSIASKSIEEVMKDKAPNLIDMFSPKTLFNFYQLTQNQNVDKDFINQNIQNVHGFQNVEFTDFKFNEDGYKIEMYDDIPVLLGTLNYKKNQFELISPTGEKVSLMENEKNLKGYFHYENKSLPFEFSQTPTGIKATWIDETKPKVSNIVTGYQSSIVTNVKNYTSGLDGKKAYVSGTLARDIKTYKSSFVPVDHSKRVHPGRPGNNSNNYPTPDNKKVFTQENIPVQLPEMNQFQNPTINGMSITDPSMMPVVVNGVPIVYGNSNYVHKQNDAENALNNQYNSDPQKPTI